MIRLILVLGLLVTAASGTYARIEVAQQANATIQQPHLNYVLDEAAMVWGIPFNEMEEAYYDGLVKIEETNVYARYRVTFGGTSAIVSIEDRL